MLYPGLLGSVTKTASVDACPGRCIHSLASLICDDVREEVQCPSPNMRCCVEKGGGMPPLKEPTGDIEGFPPLPKEEENKEVSWSL